MILDKPSETRKEGFVTPMSQNSMFTLETKVTTDHRFLKNHLRRDLTHSGIA